MTEASHVRVNWLAEKGWYGVEVKRGTMQRLPFGSTTVVLASVVAACNVATVVSLERLLAAAASAVTVLQALQQLMNASSSEMGSALAELRPEVAGGQVGDLRLKSMERRLAHMREGASQLEAQFKVSSKAIAEYLDLLETRAKQNKTPELKEQLLKDIDAQRTALDERLARARKAFERLEGAIQKYDDILGFLQVHRGLNEVRERLGTIDQTIVEAQQLNRDVDTAVREGIEIINKLSNGAGAGGSGPRVPPSVVPPPTADCSGGVACPTAMLGEWWCTGTGCACASGLQLLEGSGSDSIQAGQSFDLRFSSTRHADKDPVCDGSASETVCFRKQAGTWQCSSRGEACQRRGNQAGPSSIESARVATEDFVSRGLEISVWSEAPDVSFLDEASRLASIGRPPEKLIAWQKQARHGGGVKKGALCVGVRFKIPASPSASGEERIVTLFLTP